MDLTAAQQLGGYELFKVLIVCYYLNWVYRSFELRALLLEGTDDC